jgi:sulfur carrier protein
LISVRVNGEVKEVPEGLTVSGLLDTLGFPGDRVAVERNREIVPRDRWAGTKLQAGDRLEIVHFVGGG